MKSERAKAEAQQPDPLFSKTRWSMVLRAKDQSTEAMNTLCEKYREPLVVWLRARQNEFHPLEPEDLVDGFLSAKLEEQFLKNIAPVKGRFRTFMLTCLRNYVSSEFRKLKAVVRGGNKPHVSLEQTNEEGRPIVEPVSAEPGPDRAYDAAWAQTIVENAHYRLEAELATRGHVPLWEALQPHLYKEEGAPCYAQIAKQFGMTENALGTAACRFRKRLRQLILEELRETVATEEDFATEAKHFRELFSPAPYPAAVA
jgi:RNA polymerase sigma-70 factor (ECF subfamily)